MAVHDVVIVGAGIAGLSAAWELRKRGIEPLVLEQSHRAGGVILTEHSDGFVIDGGPDSLLVQKPAGIALCEELGLRERLIPTLPPRTAFVLRDRTLVPLPEASFLGLPTRIGPFVGSHLFSVARQGANGERDRPSAARRSPTNRSAASSGAVSACEAVRLSRRAAAGGHSCRRCRGRCRSHSLFPRLVALEQSHGSVLRGLRAERRRSVRARGRLRRFRGGMAELPEALATALGAGAVTYGTTCLTSERHGAVQPDARHRRRHPRAHADRGDARLGGSADAPLARRRVGQAVRRHPVRLVCDGGAGVRPGPGGSPAPRHRICRAAAGAEDVDGGNLGIVEVAASCARRSCPDARVRRRRHRSPRRSHRVTTTLVAAVLDELRSLPRHQRPPAVRRVLSLAARHTAVRRRSRRPRARDRRSARAIPGCLPHRERLSRHRYSRLHRRRACGRHDSGGVAALTELGDAESGVRSEDAFRRSSPSLRSPVSCPSAPTT